jgi:hypothetical protein
MESCCGKGQEKVSLLSFVCNIILSYSSEWYSAIEFVAETENKLEVSIGLLKIKGGWINMYI